MQGLESNEMKIIKAKRIKISFHWSLKLSSCFSADVVMKVSKDLKPEARLDGRSGRKKLKLTKFFVS